MVEFNSETLTSGVFRFVINDKVVELHRALVSQASEPLDHLINGQFTESAKREVQMTGVDHETFSRFGQWLYTGKYLAADPLPRSETAYDDEVDDINHDNDPDGSSSRWLYSLWQNSDWWKRSKVGDEEVKRQMEEKMKHNIVTTWNKPSDYQARINLKTRLLKEFLRVGTTATPIDQPTFNHPSDLDYTETLLSHARLYVFADQWQIGELKQQALIELFEALLTFLLTHKRISDIVSLARFVYENTATEGNNGRGKEPLRQLLLRHMEENLSMLIDDTSFKHLMAENRDFLSHVTFCLGERLRNFERRVAHNDSKNIKAR